MDLSNKMERDRSQGQGGDFRRKYNPTFMNTNCASSAYVLQMRKNACWEKYPNPKTSVPTVLAEIQKPVLRKFLSTDFFKKDFL